MPGNSQTRLIISSQPNFLLYSNLEMPLKLDQSFYFGLERGLLKYFIFSRVDNPYLHILGTSYFFEKWNSNEWFDTLVSHVSFYSISCVFQPMPGNWKRNKDWPYRANLLQVHPSNHLISDSATSLGYLVLATFEHKRISEISMEMFYEKYSSQVCQVISSN